MILVLETLVVTVGEAVTEVAVGVESDSESVDDVGRGADRDGDVNGGDNARGGESDGGFWNIVFVVDLWRELYTRSMEIHTNVVIKFLLFKVSSIDQ